MLAEQKHGKLQPSTLHAVSAAKQLGGGVTVLVAGKALEDTAHRVSSVEGVEKVAMLYNSMERLKAFIHILM